MGKCGNRACVFSPYVMRLSAKSYVFRHFYAIFGVFTFFCADLSVDNKCACANIYTFCLSG